MSMTLQDWLRSKWLVAHATSAQEIHGLLAVAAREMADAQVKGLSVDARFGHAYNAALQSALAALAAAGYRVARGESHHHRGFHSLVYTVGCDDELIGKLDKLRKKRNISDYEQAGSISGQEADEMVRLAHDLRKTVEDWLRREHPALMEN
jgi:hypothetical protein